MTSYRWQLAALLLVAVTANVHAQRNVKKDPHIGYVYPGGGQVGTSFDVTVGGQYVLDVEKAYISGGGVSVKVTKGYRPMTQGEYNSLRNKLNAARDKLQGEGKKATPELVVQEAGVTEDQLKERDIYLKREADKKRQPNAQIAEEITLHVEIDATADTGERELRLITPSGMSNPIWFYVAQWPEVRETEPNDKTADGVIGAKLPAVVNGQIMPGDVDRFKFSAREGTRLVIVTSARELVPYLADAVPGWFQAVLALEDGQGNEVAYAGAYYFRQDPVIYYEVPKDGEYVVEIRDSIYRGREDFVYRITIGELPFVTGMFPLGGRAGSELEVELLGWNLHSGKLLVDAYYDRRRPLRWFDVPQSHDVTLRVPLAIDMLPDCMEEESNDTREEAQKVEYPTIVNGRIDQPGDVDLFQFEGYGRFVAEVYARRFGSPVDSRLRIEDASGKVVDRNDDYEDRGLPLLTHHADSRILGTLPGIGTYYVRLTDSQRNGGKDFTYRLHIRRPRPDFELRVVPSSIAATPGATVPIEVHALRREGFDEDIQLVLDEPPPGFTLSGAWVPSGQAKMRMTLTIPPTPTNEPVRLQMEGRSRGRGRKLARLAVPAEEMMQAFLWTHLVPAKDWTVFVSGDSSSKAPAHLVFDQTSPVRLIAGESATFRALTTGKMSLEQVRLELSLPPDGIAVESVAPEGAGLAVTISTDASVLKTEFKGNLIFNAFREWSTPSADDDKPPTVRRVALGMQPAVPFEVVVPKTLSGRSRRKTPSDD